MTTNGWKSSGFGPGGGQGDDSTVGSVKISTVHDCAFKRIVSDPAYNGDYRILDMTAKQVWYKYPELHEHDRAEFFRRFNKAKYRQAKSNEPVSHCHILSLVPYRYYYFCLHKHLISSCSIYLALLFYLPLFPPYHLFKSDGNGNDNDWDSGEAELGTQCHLHRHDPAKSVVVEAELGTQRHGAGNADCFGVLSMLLTQVGG